MPLTSGAPLWMEPISPWKGESVPLIASYVARSCCPVSPSASKTSSANAVAGNAERTTSATNRVTNTLAVTRTHAERCDGRPPRARVCLRV